MQKGRLLNSIGFSNIFLHNHGAVDPLSTLLPLRRVHCSARYHASFLGGTTVCVACLRDG